MGHRRIGSVIIIHHHSRTVDAGADTVIKHKWHPIVHKLAEVVILSGILGLRHDDATHLILIEVVADCHLLVVTLVALCHHHTITARTRFLFYSREDRRKVVMHKLWNDYADNLHWLAMGVAQRLTNDIRAKVMFFRVCLDAFFL